MAVPFRIAVFSDEVSQDLDRIVQVCKDYALPGIELRSIFDTPPQSLSAEQIETIRKRLDGEGLSVCCISSPFYKCRIDSPEEIAAHHDILRRSIDLAHALDAPIVRGFTFWRDGAFDDARLNRVLDLYETPLAILESMDGSLGIENEGSTSTGTGAEVSRFLDALGHPRVDSIWDCGNHVAMPGAGPGFPEDFEAQKPWMAHIHIKDGVADSDGKFHFVRLGDGQSRVRQLLTALAGEGYDGWISLETHWRPAALSEEEMNRPGGSSFSQDGEFASRACLDAMKSWLNAM
ncbi:MAG: Xylose isomerase-like TIM barrel [candidate division BRC1 bacterium ADurb.BinA364]|nr:MAG: Xylose isomerase-like TIM barrel [candidate division BRC1 bacterium ADurb.BinA364]